MGFRKAARPRELRRIRLADARIEPLPKIINDAEDVRLEVLAARSSEMPPEEFVESFCQNMLRGDLLSAKAKKIDNEGLSAR